MAGNVSPNPNPNNTQYTPAEQSRNRRTLYIAGAALGGVLVLCCAIVSIAAIISNAGAKATATQPPSVHKSTSTPALPTATLKPKVWTVVQHFSGNGQNQTPTFSISSTDWRLVWSCDPASFSGSSYNVIITVYNSDGTPAATDGVNTICSGSNMSGTTEVHNVTGDLYLSVISEAAWTAKVEVLQ